MQTVIDYSQQYFYEKKDFDNRYEKLRIEALALQEHKNYSDEEIEKFIARKLGYFSPLTNVIKKRMDFFNPAQFEFSEIFDHYVDRFDLFVITDCKHMTDKYKN